MPRVHRAAWVLPIAGPPMRDAWVLIDRGRILDAGAGQAPGPGNQPGGGEQEPAAAARAGVATAILPGLVNAHTHLELSWMQALVPPNDRFDEWIRTLVSLRRQNPGAVSAGITDAAVAALKEARGCGSIAFGDVSNTLLTPLLFDRTGAVAHVFYELIGFNETDPESRVRRAREHIDATASTAAGVRISLSPHAPYTVSPALLRAIRHDVEAHPEARCTVHLGESADEVEFLRHGGGALARALQALGAWNADWRPPGCSPTEYLERFGMIDRRLIAVHGVQFTAGDLERLAAADAALVTCPRSNRWTGAGTPPVASFYASGVRVAIGTDSLASVGDLNMFNELAAVRALAPGVPASRVLHSATLAGAEALGFAEDLGSIEPGKRAALIAVDVPGDVEDVEEYLVGGRVAPSDIRWLDSE